MQSISHESPTSPPADAPRDVPIIRPYNSGSPVSPPAHSPHHSVLGQDGEVYPASHWNIEAAIETASRISGKLSRIPAETIIESIKATARLLPDEPPLPATFSGISGKNSQQTGDQPEVIQKWAEAIEVFRDKALPSENGTIEWRPSAPVFLSLPSNMDEEISYLIFQVILSQNPLVVRPSRRGSSTPALSRFIKVWQQAVATVCEGEEAETLRHCVSSIPMEEGIPWDQIAIDGWSYLLFGSNRTLRMMDREIRDRCDPRTILGFGNGLSISVVTGDADIDSAVPEILSSAAINAGNDCISTDIVYVEHKIRKRFETELARQLPLYRSFPPETGKGIGVVPPENFEMIFAEVNARGKTHFLNFDTGSDQNHCHLSALPLSEFETAIEYPGPIFSVRSFQDFEDLHRLIRKDLSVNEQSRNLVTSIFCGSEESWNLAKQATRTWLCKRNRPTHDFDPMFPHQGVFITRELSEPHYCVTE